MPRLILRLGAGVWDIAFGWRKIGHTGRWQIPEMAFDTDFYEILLLTSLNRHYQPVADIRLLQKTNANLPPLGHWT